MNRLAHTNAHSVAPQEPVMTPIPLFRLAVLTAALAGAALAGCSSAPIGNAALDQARGDYRAVQAQPQAQAYAGAELKQAGDALGSAEAAFARKDEPATVDHLAYLAKQRSALAQAAIDRKGAEASVAEASAARDQMRLAARTAEADRAEQSASRAQREALAASQQAEQSRQRAGDAESRNLALQAQLRELNARPTDRGMVVTIGDVLFDTGKARLLPGGIHNVEKLGAFLKTYPQRKAMIDGYTDSVGSDEMNVALSSRRADAVRSALVGMGVGSERLGVQGHGEANPVAGNDNAGGRQMNRRVEVLLSDESGALAPR
jgi:outer membrane protein OmpA-like peptidoglycan-associated protein